MPESTKQTTELNGWKEIANFLGISVRTAQALEKEQSLPVRRRLGIKGRVYSSASELHTWRDSQVLLPQGFGEPDQRTLPPGGLDRSSLTTIPSRTNTGLLGARAPRRL